MYCVCCHSNRQKVSGKPQPYKFSSLQHLQVNVTMCVCVCVCVCVCMCVCMYIYVCMYVCMYVYMYGLVQRKGNDSIMKLCTIPNVTNFLQNHLDS